jgi:hypothetical protein
MPRASWFDDNAEVPIIQERLEKLESFTSALADGAVSAQELSSQEKRVAAAMKQVEGLLNDEQHASVTTLLVELSAYNVMRLLHELRAEHARAAFGKSA